jgi:Secretion system C-terminal sorting domain
VRSIATEESVSGLLALNLLNVVEGTVYYEDFPVIDEEELTAERLMDQPYVPSSYWMQPAPNPVNTEMTILFAPEFSSDGAQLILSDVFGQMVWSYFVPDDFASVTIPANNLSSGLYYLQLKTGGELIETQKVVVNR